MHWFVAHDHRFDARLSTTQHCWHQARNIAPLASARSAKANQIPNSAFARLLFRRHDDVESKAKPISTHGQICWQIIDRRHNWRFVFFFFRFLFFSLDRLFFFGLFYAIKIWISNISFDLLDFYAILFEGLIYCLFLFFEIFFWNIL